MSIYDVNLINGKTKLETALERIKYFEPEDGYYLAFSGGKDSIVCYKLLELAGVKFDSHYNNTTVDPPDLIYYIRENYKDVEMHNPELSMWKLIEKKKLPPTRVVRYCCEALKEGGGSGRFVVTGVRWAESNKRKTRKVIEYDAYGSQSKKAIKDREIFLNNDNSERRKMIESCAIKGKNILNPIIDWEDDEVWEFIIEFKIKYCKLYDEGWDRIGCVGCPMVGTEEREREFNKYPKIKANYIRAFEKMLINRRKNNLPTKWETGENVMKWWLSGEKIPKKDKNQLEMKI